jgi:quinolinate synthase
MSSVSPTPSAPLEVEAYRALDASTLVARIQAMRAALGPRLLILGHHYQQESVIALSDLRGDSFKLSQQAAANRQCEAIVFCGVHFMAETADILANRPEAVAERGGRRVTVVLPDVTAGCSMADMAQIEQVEDCWQQLAAVIDVDDLTPVTYVNSAANLKAFCGRHGGIVCTSGNARAVLEWAWARRRRILFFPDQHLGRNTARAMGVPLEQMPMWDPSQRLGGLLPATLQASRLILWNGYCCVHQVFHADHIRELRGQYSGIRILVHPECSMEVVDQADAVGSTEKIIRLVQEAPVGTRWAIGTEPNLVHRLQQEHPEQEIRLLSPTACLCETMYRIDLAHVCWSLEHLAAGTPVGVIRVDDETARWALQSLQRMLEVK